MKIIAFDGPTSVGKTTQINLFCEYVKNQKKTYILNDEHGGIRDYINKYNSRNYYKKEIGQLAESFLWFAHYANRIEEIINNEINVDYIIFDRFIYTPIIYQYLTLNIENKTNFKEFSRLLNKLFNLGITLPNYCKLHSIILNANFESLEERYKNREKKELDVEEENILRKSIDLYNSDFLGKTFNSNKILIDTVHKNISTIHNELISELDKMK